jgi:hypothetical protein
MESSLPRPLDQYNPEHIAAAVGNLGPAYADYAKKIIEQGIDGFCLIDLMHLPGDMTQFLVELGVSLVAHRTRLKRLFMDMHHVTAGVEATFTFTPSAGGGGPSNVTGSFATPATPTANVSTAGATFTPAQPGATSIVLEATGSALAAGTAVFGVHPDIVACSASHQVIIINHTLLVTCFTPQSSLHSSHVT